MEFDTVTEEGINHLTHPYPNHNLKPTNVGPNKFLCGACKCIGTGAAYKCKNPTCTFTLHVPCASITTDHRTLSFFLHPKHPLSLLTESSHLKVKKPVTCALCVEEVLGLWYRCAPCSFDVHPICSHLPPLITDRAHPGHEMKLIARSILAHHHCSRCGARCKECYYRCTECDFISHLECLFDVSGPVFCYKVAHSIHKGPNSSAAAASDDDSGKLGGEKTHHTADGLSIMKSSLKIANTLSQIL